MDGDGWMEMDDGWSRRRTQMNGWEDMRCVFQNKNELGEYMRNCLESVISREIICV